MTVRTYLRISQEDEKDILENQRTDTHREALALGMGEPVVYEEVESGGKDNRSQFDRLLKDLRRGDIVVFTSLSRMTRGGVAATFEFLRRIEVAGAGWRFTEQSVLNFDSSTPKMARDIILSVLAAVDEEYRARISRATKAAYARRKALAEANGDAFEWGRRGPDRKKRVPYTKSEVIALRK